MNFKLFEKILVSLLEEEKIRRKYQLAENAVFRMKLPFDEIA